MIIKRIIAMLAAAVLIVAAAGCANKATDPVSSTTAEETAATASPSTTKSSVIPVAPSSKPVTTASSYTPPTIEYGGTLGTEEDSVRIASHEVSLSTNNTYAIKLDVDILTCSGTKEHIFIGYDCYDADGNKLNEKPVMAIVSLRQDKTKTLAIASAPFETVKVVFRNV